jgi:two-component system, chemotaxis family, chemotaxis protein CheY
MYIMEASAPKKVLLVGHCGPDANYLRMTVRSALGDITLSSAEDNNSLDRAIEQGVDLILFNRELDYGFKPATGVEMIATLKPDHPDLKMILVSNFPEVQTAAEAAGALPGFGKREIGSPRVKELLRSAVGLPVKA